MAKETWRQGQCQEVEGCLRNNNSKKAYQLVKDLTTEKQDKSTTMQASRGMGPIVLNCPQTPYEEHRPILREEAEAAFKALKISRRGQHISRISPRRKRSHDRHPNLKKGKWPTTWTQSLVITLPTKGN